MSNEQRKLDRQWGWALLIIGLIAIPTGIGSYHQFDNFERTGGTMTTSRRTASFYKTFGKSGFLYIFTGAGVICLGVSAYKFCKREPRPTVSTMAPSYTPSTAKMPCPRCGAELKSGASFCRYCQTWLE